MVPLSAMHKHLNPAQASLIYQNGSTTACIDTRMETVYGYMLHAKHTLERGLLKGDLGYQTYNTIDWKLSVVQLLS